MPIFGRKIEVSGHDKSVCFIGYSAQYPFKVIEVVPILTALEWIVELTNEDEFVIHLDMTDITALRKSIIYSSEQNSLFHCEKSRTFACWPVRSEDLKFCL